MNAVDVTKRTDAAAVVLLCSFDATVKTAAGSVVPSAEGFTLHTPSRKRPKLFPVAASAVRALRKVGGAQ